MRRPLPVAKALDDVLLAYEMNGAPLPPDHGFPVRLVVPGWIGIASIKWLGRIEVADHPLFSYWNTTQYRMVGPDYPADSPPLTAAAGQERLRAALAGERCPPAAARLHGRSWSGGRPIRRVDVRVDDGRRARPARACTARTCRTRGSAGRHGAELREPGEHALLARATDRDGVTQPATVPFNTNGYQFWAVARHPVTVT